MANKKAQSSERIGRFLSCSANLTARWFGRPICGCFSKLQTLNARRHHHSASKTLPMFRVPTLRATDNLVRWFSLTKTNHVTGPRWS